jgi:hypothetical protein
MEVAKNMDSVFADCTESELEFDVFFDQEDQLIDTVVGVDESGDPLTGVDFEELHQTDDDATVKDIKDELGPDSPENNMGAKELEGTNEADLNDDQTIDNLEKNGESCADKVINTSDVEDDKANGKAPTDNTVTPVIEDELNEAADNLMPEGEDHDDIDNELDPVSAPSADGTDKDQPVTEEDPTDGGEEEKGGNLVGEPEDQQKVTATTEGAECEGQECNVEELISKVEALGYTVTKAEESNEEEKTMPADEPKAECDAPVTTVEDDQEVDDIAVALGKAGYKIVKINDEPQATTPIADKCNEDNEVESSNPPEGADPDEAEDNAAPEGECNEAADIDDELDNDIDDDTIEAAEDNSESDVDLSYDVSDEEIIDIALGK